MDLVCFYCITADPPNREPTAEIIYDGYSLCLNHVPDYQKMLLERLRSSRRDVP